MNDHRRFTIGSGVECGDGSCGKLQRVVVDPVAGALTHLVVEPRHGSGAGHLVPIALVDPAADGIVLTCTTAEFELLEFAEETHFVAGSRGEWGYEQEHILSWPYYGLGMGSMGGGGVGAAGGAGLPPGSETVTYERVPAGEVQVRRGEPVHAADGDIGRVQGLIVDPADHAVTHVLLEEGHLWGKKQVAVPISAVDKIDGTGVRLLMTKEQVGDLPPIEVDGLFPSRL